MFRPELYRADDPAVAAARDRASDALYSGVADLPGRPVRDAGLAAWSMAHGFATLWLSGALPDVGADPDAAARTILRQLTGDA
jgi:hypothetical protein